MIFDENDDAVDDGDYDDYIYNTLITIIMIVPM